MPSELILNAALGLVPVVLFLVTLILFDSFKLIRAEIVSFVIAAGVIAAVAAYFVNTWLLGVTGVAFNDYMHFGAPVVEEGLKALIVLALFLTSRIAFAFDAIILGFAAGAGFALAENFFYLTSLGSDHPAVWMIRGFGTAIMHGGTTAVFAMAGRLLSQRQSRLAVIAFLPGFIVAITLHAGFNFFLDYPVTSTIAMLALFASSLALILNRDEKSIHDWLKTDFARHRAMLREIETGRLEHERLNRLVAAMRRRFGAGVADEVTDYIRLHTELVVAAEEILLAHESGSHAPVSAEVQTKLNQFVSCENRLGRTAVMVLSRHLHFTRREIWEIHMLAHEADRKSGL